MSVSEAFRMIEQLEPLQPGRIIKQRLNQLDVVQSESFRLFQKP